MGVWSWCDRLRAVRPLVYDREQYTGLQYHVQAFLNYEEAIAGKSVKLDLVGAEIQRLMAKQQYFFSELQLTNI